MKSATIPKNKTVNLLLLLLSASMVLASCSTALEGGASTPDPQTPANQTGNDQNPEPTNLVFSEEDLGRVSPDAILLELAYEPTFSRIEASYTYGVLPVFTLFGDGRVIYTVEGASYEEERIMFAQLSRQETLSLIQKVLVMGFDKLENHTDFCETEADGSQQCVADAAYSILRMRTTEDSLKEVKIYADFANDLVAYTSITDYLSGYTHADAKPYIPDKAALFLSKNAADTSVTTIDWPLDPILLAYPENDMNLRAIVLDGKALSDYLAVVDRNVGDAFFESNGVIYRAYLVSWLPGEDYSEQLRADFAVQ